MASVRPHSQSESHLVVEDTALHSTFLQAARPRPDNVTAVILHGAGESDSQRHAGLARIFADNGISVIALDFVGHGKTGGAMTDSSLELRRHHARAVINHWTDEKDPLILCGFSMSGHLVLRLLPKLGRRVKSIGLFCPAIYAAEAETVQFDPEFTKILREPESWRSSLALKDAAQFTGRAAVIIGIQDTVIPKEIIDELMKVLRQNTEDVRREIVEGVGHQLAAWLSEHKKFSQDIVQYLAGEAKV